MPVSSNPKQIESVAVKAMEIRADILRMLVEAGSGHSAGSFGMADVFASLFFGGILHFDAKKPWMEDRDRLILSNGHICPVFYATLAEAGYFPKTELSTLRKLGSRLQGHPLARKLPGIETTSGSLGQGLSQACGFALAAKMKKKTWHTYCLMGDGEQQEGQVWEGYWFAGNHALSNLTVMIDRNKIQSDGFTEATAGLEPFRAKLESFRWDVIEVDGHDIVQIIEACHQARAMQEKPVAIILHTIPGKGIDFMEGKPEWHAKVPSSEQAISALKNLNNPQGRVSYE